MKIIPVILCGGTGTRLWPLSQAEHPKQFLYLGEQYSLLQRTVLRALHVTQCEADELIVVTAEVYKDLTHQHLTSLNCALDTHVLCEPAQRNTAAAIALAVHYAHKEFGDDVQLLVLSSDAHIDDADGLANAVKIAAQEASLGQIAIFGMEPTRAETGYGYILADGDASTLGAFNVGHFVEKPPLALAQQYVEDGRYLWNSGMFLFDINTILDEFALHAPQLLDLDYNSIEPLPIDKAILEKSSNVVVVPCDIGWSDIGTWQSLWDTLKKDRNNNHLRGHVVAAQSQHNLVYAAGKPVVCAGVDNLLIIETPDMFFIADRRHSDTIATLSKTLNITHDEAAKRLKAHNKHMETETLDRPQLIG